MIFDKWKAITSQTLANEYMSAKLSKGKKGIHNGLSEDFIKTAFDNFSHNESIQYRAYATYDGEKVEDTTMLLQICNGV